MADPKYANLPGIDLNSPDTYETSELPEDDQAQALPEDPANENIDRGTVDAKEAFGKFKGKSIDAKSTDFSDRIYAGRRTGYEAQTEYEMAGEGTGVPETPQEKFQRLQHEIRQLSEDVGKIQENIKSDSASESLSPVAMAKQAEFLQQQLNELHLDKLLGGNGGVNLTDPQGALQKRLITQLQSFLPESVATKAPNKKPGSASGDADHVTYELYYRPEEAKFSNNARVADLEQRLERIEALLGNSPEKISYLTADTSSKTLLESVALLSAKTKLLEPAHVEQIEGRLHMLAQKLGQVAEKKTGLDDADKQKKIGELHELTKKWDSLANTLPHIVDRLTVLKDLHEQALQFNQTITHLDKAQEQLGTNLTEHGDMMKQIRSTLAENMKTMHENCQNLDKRLASIKK